MTDPIPNPPAANLSGDDLKFRLERLDRQIGLEHSIIGQRMAWLMVSQSFLFSAFAISVSPGRLPQTPTGNVLQHIVPVIGMATALTVGLALLAVHRVMERLRPERDKLEQLAAARGFESLGTKVSRSDYVLGDLPSKVLPWFLLVTWVVLMVSAAG